MVAREGPGVEPTSSEIADPAEAQRELPKLPHGAHIAPLVSRLALGVMVLSHDLDRGASRAAIGVALQRSRPRGVVLLGHELGRELLAEEVEASAAGLIEKQQWQAAVEVLRNGEPLGPRGTNMLGRALLQLGDREAARRAFERTLTNDPGNSIAQRQLANLSS